MLPSWFGGKSLGAGIRWELVFQRERQDVGLNLLGGTAMNEADLKAYREALDHWHLELAMLRDAVNHHIVIPEGPDEWWLSLSHILQHRFDELVEQGDKLLSDFPKGLPFPSVVTAGAVARSEARTHAMADSAG